LNNKESGYGHDKNSQNQSQTAKEFDYGNRDCPELSRLESRRGEPIGCCFYILQLRPAVSHHNNAQDDSQEKNGDVAKNQGNQKK
jgi:hypothetical protein